LNLYLIFTLLEQGHVRGVTPIVGARVPVLKVTDCGTGVECDISIENKDGISRSTIISFVSSIDERFRILSYLVIYIHSLMLLHTSTDH
jgi:DNA polymerase sigma